MKRLCTLILCTILVILVFKGDVKAGLENTSFLGKNIFTQGNFESWTRSDCPEGWKCESEEAVCAADERVYIYGSKSVKLHIPTGPGKIHLISSLVPIIPGKYFVRFAFKVEEASKGNVPEGVSINVRIAWLNQETNIIREDMLGCSSTPQGWRYHNQIYQAPPNSTNARVEIWFSADSNVKVPSTVWFDDMAICPYHSPEEIGETALKEWSPIEGREILKVQDAKAWFYLLGDPNRSGFQSPHTEVVSDKETFLGYALHIKSGIKIVQGPYAGIVWEGPNTVEQPQGLYRVFIRMKAPSTERMAEIGMKETWPLVKIGLNSGDGSIICERSFTFNDFKQQGQYEDILSFDFLKRTSTNISIIVHTPNNRAEFWIDHIRIVELKHFNDSDLVVWFPGFVGFLDKVSELKDDSTNHFLLVAGLLSDTYHIEDAIKNINNSELLRIQYNNNIKGHDGGSISGFPDTWSVLQQYDVIVIANANIGCLGPEQRFLLREFVRVGGGLFILGGKTAYGNGGIKGSFLEEVLPVEVADTRFDIDKVDGLLVKTESPLLGGLNWQPDLGCSYLHQVKLRKNAQVILKVGKSPFLISGVYGKGRVACLLGTPYGVTTKDYMTFTDWQDRMVLMRNVLQWLAKREEVVGGR